MITPANPVTPSGATDAANSFGQPGTYAGAVKATALAPPTPGTIVIHLGGKVEFDAAAIWTSGSTAQSTPTVAAGSAKLNPITFGAQMRLYPGVDGMATNGLRYGASVEIRQNFPGSAAQPSPNLSPAPSASTFSSGQTLYVRRAFAYVAADNLGLLRMGQSDGVLGLFDNCTFTSQCWDLNVDDLNGTGIQSLGPAGPVGVPFAWLSQSGAEYGNTKIVYLSPQLFGVDIGVQYAPSMGNGFAGCAAANSGTSSATANNNNQAETACNLTTTGGDPTRWYNQVGVGARWQGSFGPADAGVYAFYETAAKESFFGPSAGPTLTGPATTRFDNLSFLSAGAYTKFNLPIGAVTVAADYIGGALNGQLAMRPTGGVPEHAVIAGVTFNNGPVTLGVTGGLVESQGAAALTGVTQRHEYEFNFGGNYNLAPGLYLVGEYIYMSRHQGGFDFNTGALGAGTTATHAGLTRDSRAQGILFSTIVNW